MGKPFSELEKRYQDFLKFKGDINSLNNEDPLKGYIKWKQWDSKANHKIPAANVPDRNGTSEILVHPFALDYQAGDGAIFIGQSITGRSLAFINSGGAGAAIKAQLQHQAATRATTATVLSSNVKLQSAKVTVFQVLGTAKTVPSSRITGKSYKTNRGNSYSVGFGKASSGDSYDERTKAILAVVPNGYKATFQQERYKKASRKIAATTP